MKVKMDLVRVALLCLLFVMVSCGGGSDYPSREYLILNYEVTAAQYKQPIDENYGSASAVPAEWQVASPIGSAEVVDWSRFSIQLRSTLQIYQVSHQWLPAFNLFSQAIASSAGIPTAGQRLTAISITSDNAYTDAYPAGAELSRLAAPIFNSHYQYPPQNIKLFLPGDIKTMADLSGRNLGAPAYLNIKLLSEPQYARQNFEIKITLDDGSIFKLRTGDIYFSVANH